MERTALYAQAVAELHGVHVHDPETARSMVMVIMLGEEGSQLMNTVLLQTGKASGVSNKWGMLLGNSSGGKMFSVERTIRNLFIRRFLSRQTGALLGRAPALRRGCCGRRRRKPGSRQGCRAQHS